MMQMDPSQSIGASHWGGPMMGNGGPMGPMGPIGVPNTGFNYNYGSTPSSNPSFGWPQQQAWGSNNYAVPPQAQQSAQGYGAYDYNGPMGYTNSTPSNYGANGNNWSSWNPNIAPNTGSSSSDMYRPQSGHNMHSAPPPANPAAAGGNLSKPGSEYNGAAAYNGAAYPNYYSEQQFSNQNRPRSYGNNDQQYPAF
jgi:hypothetical protein